MYKKIISILVLTSCLVAQSSYDYAYGLEINADGRDTLSRVNIPNDVYLRTLSPSLEDVAIFNKNDQAVAFSFIGTKRAKDITQEIPATLYFINKKNSNTANNESMYTYTYFIELSNKTEYPSFFNLNWESSDYNWEAKANINIQLSNSGNISAANGVLLAELKDVSDESSLRISEIVLRDYSYYSNIKGWQLVITSDVEIPKITSVEAYTKEQYIDQSFVALDAEYKETINNSIVYEFQSIQPVESVFINLRQSNLILPLTLFYKDSSKDKWVKFDGRIVNEDADIKLQKTVFAKEFMLKTNGGFNNIPQFTVYRKRIDIVFNSANNAPFVLAYGSFGAKALGLPESDFLSGIDIDDIPIVNTGNFVKLGEEKALETKIEEKNRVPEWAIWIALVLGVAFLVFLAYKLSKELKSS
ncbi:MAG: DUF3999 domain-containing protein [Campylobacteraceae bacterium]|jgi:hypothetical protein|nr:DUF3999 domain-containing protein [Campylobacteraceae bacterium]